MASIVPADKLPERISFYFDSSNNRAETKNLVICIDEKESVQGVAHELGHIIEDVNPELKKKNARFLYNRTRGSKYNALQERFPNEEYEKNEFVLEDEWEIKGNNIYSGKIPLSVKYDENISENDFVNAIEYTEIVSMGIERMISEPAKFKRQDPEFYNFIQSIMQ